MTAALVAGVIACWGAALVVVVMLHRAHTAPSPCRPAPLPARRWHAHALTEHGEVCLEDGPCPFAHRIAWTLGAT